MIMKKRNNKINTFEYIINDSNRLDDLILLKEVDVDSMTAETYGIKEYK